LLSENRRQLLERLNEAAALACRLRTQLGEADRREEEGKQRQDFLVQRLLDTEAQLAAERLLTASAERGRGAAEAASRTLSARVREQTVLITECERSVWREREAADVAEEAMRVERRRARDTSIELGLLASQVDALGLACAQTERAARLMDVDVDADAEATATVLAGSGRVPVAAKPARARAHASAAAQVFVSVAVQDAVDLLGDDDRGPFCALPRLIVGR